MRKQEALAADPLPAIQAVSYVPGVIVITMASTPAVAVTGAVFKGNPVGTGWLATAQSSGNLVMISVDPNSLDPHFEYTVALSASPSALVWGPPTVLVFQQPTLTSIIATATAVDVAWSLPPITEITEVTAILSSSTSSTAIAMGTVTVSGIRLIPAVPLNLTDTYSVTLIGRQGISQGPSVQSTDLILTAPSVTTVTYTATGSGGSCQLVVTPSAIPTVPETVVGQLYQGEFLADQQLLTNGVITFNRNNPLDPRYAWSVCLSYMSGVVLGPLGPSYPIATPEPPRIKNLFYAAGNVTVILDQAVVPTATVALFQGAPTGTGWMVSTTTKTSSASFPINPKGLNPNYTYYVALTLDSTASPVIWTSATQLVFQNPAIANIAVSSTSVDVAWTLPTPTNITKVFATVYDGTSSQSVAWSEFDGSNGSLALGSPLNSAHTYTVELSGGTGNSVGQTISSNALVTSSPTITDVVYAANSTGTAWTVTVSASGATGSLVGFLMADGIVVSELPGSGTSVLFSLSSALDPSSQWQVALAYVSGTLGQAGVIVGPLGSYAEIPVVPPVLTSASYDGINFSIEWTPSFRSSGARVSVVRTDTGVEIGSQVVSVGQAAHFTPSTAPDVTKEYKVYLYPLLGLSKGVPGPGTTLIVGAPTIQSIVSDGYGVAVTTSAATTGNVVVSLQSSATTVTSTVGGPNGGYVPIPTTGVSAPSIVVQAINGIISGPTSTAAPVTLAVPAVSGLQFTSTAVTGTVTVPNDVSLTNQQVKVALYADEILVGSPVSATDGSFSLPITAPTGSALSVRAFVIGNSGTVTITTPSSPPVPVLTNAAEVVSALLVQTGASAWQVSAEWAISDTTHVSSYTVSFIQTVSLATWSVEGLSFTQTAPSFDATKPVTLTVTAQGNHGTAPVSLSVTFIPQTPTLSSSSTNGSSISAQWAPVSQATGYRVRLVAHEALVWRTVGQSEVVSAPMASFALPSVGLDLTVEYGLLVDVQVGVAWTSSFVPVTLPMVSPTITKATATAPNIVKLDWTAPAVPTSGISNYVPVVRWNDTELSLAEIPSSPLEASITLPAGVPKNAEIYLRPIVSGATGPGSNATPLVFESSTGLSLVYDGANLGATWDASNDPRVNAYSVTYAPSTGSPTTTTVSTNSFQQAVASPPVGFSATVSVAPIAGLTTAQGSATVSGVFQAPTVQKTSYDGANLSASWSTVVGATGYRVLVMAGGMVTQSVYAGSTSATLGVPNGAFTIQVQALGVNATGPASTPAFQPIFGQPQVTSTMFDAQTGDLTIQWTTVTNAQAYSVELVASGGVPITKKVSGTQLLLLAADVPSEGVYSISVQACASLTDNNNVGPWSPLASLVVIPPTQVAVDYNGREALVSWNPVEAESVSGYQVTLVGGSQPTSAFTSVPKATLALPYDASKTYTVIVQAVTKFGNGQPTSATSIFQPGWYASTDTTKAPNLSPVSGPAMTPYDIVVNLPNIFATTVTTGLPTTPPFVFATTSAPFAYTLTMPHDSIVWSFDANPIRAGVLTAYNALLQALTTLGMTPNGWRVVQDAIARSMPQTFAETLLYGYGFSPSSGYIDLKPGMVLRADYQSFQYLGPGASNTDLLNGYVTSASVEYEIGSYIDPTKTSWLTGLDAFLASITSSGSIVPAPTVTVAGSMGGGGVIDSFYSQFRKPYLRLVYPPNFLGSATSNPQAGFNVALLAADDYQTLNSATTTLRNAQPLGAGVAAIYLRGRSVLTAQMRVWLDDVPVTLPVGSTVASLLSTMGRRPPVMASLPIAGLKMTRSSGAAITSTGVGTNGYSVSQGVPIFLDWQSGTMYDALTDWLALPLMPGDQIETRGSL